MQTLLCSILILLLPVMASATTVFPQYAEGAGYQTTFFLNNLSATVTTATISFHSQSGELVGSHGLTLAAHTTMPYVPQDFGIRVGWASIETDPAVDVFATETIERFDEDGRLIADVALSPADSDTDWHTASSESTEAKVGLAVVNLGVVTTTVSITVQSASNSSLSSLQLDPDHQMTLFVPAGTIAVQSSASPIAVVALQMNSSSGSITSLPLYSSQPRTYFSPNAGISARLVQEIQRAQKSVDVAIYEFTRREIADALIAAAKRGVAIRVVADSDEASSAFSQIGRLESAGIMVRRTDGAGGGIMHNKYAIFDGRLLVTGSYNWSTAAEEDNDENALFISDSRLVSSYLEAFNVLWR
jgi:hypothetical protein